MKWPVFPRSAEVEVIELTRETINYSQLTEAVRDHSAGAVVLFLGTVREFTQGAQTDWMAYEAYPEMAQRSLQQLIDQAFQNFPITRAAVSHRIGDLQLGDISVAIAVSAPHRAQAFDAGRWMIDTLKDQVPIWKREYYSDGRVEWQHPQHGVGGAP
jgi:molybdopterin synthase catalytic subunit